MIYIFIILGKFIKEIDIKLFKVLTGYIKKEA